jgi:hypothetical protein
MSISPALPQSLVLPRSQLRILAWTRTRPWTILATVILLVHAAPFLLKQHSEWDEVYLRAAGRLLNGGDVYRFEDGYSYPPFMALLAVPFVGLSTILSRTIWFAINVGCLVGMWRLAWRLTGGGHLEGAQATDLREQLICLLGLACSVRYAMNGIAHHQTDLVIGMLLMGGCDLLSRGRDWSAASCFGLAAAMKCTALLWIPYLLLRRKWASAAWLVVLAIGVNFLPNLIRAPERGGLWLNEWLTRYVRPLTTAEHYPGDWGSWIIYNQSLSGAGNRWLTTQWRWQGSEFEIIHRLEAPSPKVVKTIVCSVEVILLIVITIVLFRRGLFGISHGVPHSNQGEILEYSAVFLLMVLLSPMSSKPHFSTLILPGFALARLAVYRKDLVLRWSLGLAVLLAALSLPLWGRRLDFIALWWGSDTWNAFLLLLGCVYLLRGSILPQPDTAQNEGLIWRIPVLSARGPIG